jgi:hypothetical protein
VNHSTSTTILFGPKHLGDNKTLSRQSEFIKLKHLLADILVCGREAEQTELLRVTTLANALNEKGFADDEIRREFAEALENGQFYS